MGSGTGTPSPAFFSGVFGTKSESDCSVCRHFSIFPKYRDIIDNIDNIAIFGRKPHGNQFKYRRPKKLILSAKYRR
ncbi:hypothetical protein C1H46_012752 [Malus baccata]|uniref:Uncharacterized protein n=1 Tax=Malus baccata TaxID=106549 RepID=A0A540MTR6_MALBA|nr:hypothetical protein C1H46_012752 [Malus baccata]